MVQPSAFFCLAFRPTTALAGGGRGRGCIVAVKSSWASYSWVLDPSFASRLTLLDLTRREPALADQAGAYQAR